MLQYYFFAISLRYRYDIDKI